MSQKFDDLNLGLTSFVAKILTVQKNDPRHNFSTVTGLPFADFIAAVELIYQEMHTPKVEKDHIVLSIFRFNFHENINHMKEITVP